MPAIAAPVLFKPSPDWRAFKLRLANDLKVLNPYFADPLESQIAAAVKSLLPASVASYRYSRFLVEPLLADVAALLDRSATYRRDAADFEVQAVRQAADYALGQQLRKIDSQLADASNQTAQENTLAKELGNAATGLSDKDALQAGLKSWLSALEDQQTALAQTSTQIYNGQVTRISAQEGAADDMNLRASQPGNSSNFAERSKRTVDLLSQDLAEAYEKASCAALGIPLIYPDSVANQVATIPDISQLTLAQSVIFLDSLIKWTRDTMRLLELRQQYETEVELVVPLVQKSPWFDSAVVDVATFTNSMALASSGELTFSLDQQKFLGAATPPVRLKAIGLSYTPTDDPSFDFVRASALVKPPPQPLNTAVKGTNYQPKSLLFGAVPMFGGSSPPAYVSGFAVQNLSPFTGAWEIRVAKYLSSKKVTQVDRTQIKDLYLHLRIVYEPG